MSVYILSMYISADLFQSECVSAYICSPPIPSTPANSYEPLLHTLQFPILQIAIYLYCKVQVALLRHLKDSGAKLRHMLPQAC